jgi:hypothetical protein
MYFFAEQNLRGYEICCLWFSRALEDLDSLLLHASRNDPSASVETMRSKISVALAALDK